MPKYRKSICRAESCNEPIKRWQDFCPAHFKMLPSDVKRKIIDLKKSGQALLWYKAVEQAITVLKNKEAAAKQASYYD